MNPVNYKLALNLFIIVVMMSAKKLHKYVNENSEVFISEVKV